MKSKAWLCLSIATVLAFSLSPLSVNAAARSPFVGHWQGIDIDSSDIRLMIGGPPGGPFQITWTEDYITFCNGEAGIVRGTGVPNESDENLLEADLVVECFGSGASREFHLTFRYHPSTGALSTVYDNGMMVVFTHPGAPYIPEPISLRVNYGHDWLESFYPAGHTVWLAVTEGDGITVKATAQVITEPKDFWGGETGFQTNPEYWVPGPPDIQPYDWVYGWVDNGASALVQIGEINGVIDLETDSIRGTVLVPWFTEELNIVCDPWGLSDPSQYRESAVYPDGVDEFDCSWSGVLDVLPGQELGVWYYGSDGHAVVNAFSTPDTRIIAFPESENLMAYGWPEGSEVYLDISGSVNFAMLTTVGPAPWDENDIMAFFDFNGLYDMMASDVVTVSGSGRVETHTVRNLNVIGFDTDANTVSGVADDGEVPFVYLFDHPEDLVINPTGEAGQWTANFDDVGIDLTRGLCGRAEIRDESGNATAVDWCVPNPVIRAWLGYPRMEGYGWPAGEWINIKIYDPGTGSTLAASALAEETEWGTFVGFSTAGWDLAPGQQITMWGAGLKKIHTILPVSINNADPDLDTVEGTASPGGRILLCVYDGGCDPPAEIFADATGYWSINYSGQLDILDGGGMDATEFDEDGDGTSFDYWIPAPPPPMSLRVNYGHDWVESFYEAGHQVAVTVTQPDGATVKATATAFTEPQDYWGGESGFTTYETGWDGGGAPDLQPGDWVFATVDNGVTAQVQLGEIAGEVFVFEDRVSGAISAPWIAEPVPVECLDWGSGGDAGNQDGGWIHTDGADSYTCAWDASVWDIQPWQEIGVGYSTPDGHWVANAFHAEHWLAVWTHDLPAGFWAEGDHSYYFDWNYSIPSPGGGGVMDPVALPVMTDASLYPGYAVLWSRSFASPLVWSGAGCEVVGSINPEQATRFGWGWVNDYHMTEQEALDHFNSFAVQVFWDGAAGGSALLSRGDLVPWYGPATSDEYRCSLAEHP